MESNVDLPLSNDRPGPPTTTSGASPTYFVPWKNKVPLSEKLDQVLKWIDLPLDERPQLIVGQSNLKYAAAIASLNPFP